MNHHIFNAVPKPIDRKGFLFDLIVYISALFLIREIYIPKVGFIANGLFWSFTTLAIATWRMKVRKVTWKELGLPKPDKLWKTLAIATFIFTATHAIIDSVSGSDRPFSIFFGSRHFL